MVTEQAEAPQLELETVPADLPVSDPVQTETPEPTEPVAPERAADDDAEAAAPEVAEPEPAPLTQAERETIRAEALEAARQEARQEAAENEQKAQRRRQSENARREADIKRTADEKAELSDTVVATLGRAGYHDVDPEMVSTVIDRSFAKKSGHVVQQTLADVTEAMAYVGEGGDWDALPPRVQDAARRIAPQLHSWVNAAADKIAEAAVKQEVPNLTAKQLAEMADPAALKELVDSQIAARNATGRSTQTEVKRVDGVPSTADRGIQAVTHRIANNDGDAEDRRLWKERYHQ